MDTSDYQQGNSIDWNDLVEAVLSDKHVDTFSSIPNENLDFILEPLNRNFIVQSILTSLIKTDNPKANATYANEIVDLMIEIAQRFRKSQA